MAPVAYGALAFVAGTAVISVVVGVLIGALVGRLKHGIVWGSLLVSAYLLVAPPLNDASLLPFISLNAPATILTFLSAYLATRHLRIRRAWLAAIAGFGCGLVVAAAYMFLFRVLLMVDIWALAWIALAVDMVLVLLVIRLRKTLQP
jgi:hypothetical protein